MRYPKKEGTKKVYQKREGPAKEFHKKDGLKSDEGKRGGPKEEYRGKESPKRDYAKKEGPLKEYQKREVTKRYYAKKYTDNRFAKKPGARKSIKRKSDLEENDGTIRLNKYIANAGICSRREADELIATGAVSVNGKIVTQLGTKISPEDNVQFGGETLRREKLVYILLNKPHDYITTTDDPEGRKTVMMLLKNAGNERIYSVGRLDRATTGLLLFTNDGDLAKKLMHPRHGIKKIYHVELDKNLIKKDMEDIVTGLELEDGIAEVDEIAYDGDGKDKKSIGIQIHSGKNRIIRRIFEKLGYKITKLDRVVYAGLTKKNLTRGRWRFLTAM
jgi:23S rRNA pseudouridine2605 synthase